jgi:hypothetical protein
MLTVQYVENTMSAAATKNNAANAAESGPTPAETLPLSAVASDAREER